MPGSLEEDKLPGPVRSASNPRSSARRTPSYAQQPPGLVYLKDWMKLRLEAGADGRWSYSLVAPKAYEGEHEQTGELAMAPFAHRKLVLLCLGAEFELSELVIEQG